MLGALDYDTIADLADIVRNPLEIDKYEALKTATLARLTDSPDTQLHKLLTGIELGDKRPSQLLRHMRTLAGNRVSDDVFRVKWLNLLQQQTRRMLIVLKKQTLEELAEVADEVHDMAPSILTTFFKRSKSLIKSAATKVNGADC